ncbi:MAG: hypothetical protein EXR11_01425 [Rhodospirillaceae bacterium]|nr:hypothetical protein [Rhodospirillaceae bacterium]
MRSVLLAVGVLSVAASAFANPYERSVVVTGINGAAPGISPHGFTGLNFGHDAKLYAGSVIGPGIYRVDVAQRTIEQVVGAPEGEADDVAMGPDGSLVWTAILSGELRARRPDGTITVLEKNLAMINPVNFTADGRLFTGQIGAPDTLFEVDPAGKKPRRVIATGMGGINAFVDDGGGGLFVPLAEKGAIGRVNLTTGAVTIIADGLSQPVSVKRDSHGGLATIDWTTGRVYHVNAASGETKRIATVPPPLDNLAIGPDDTIYVSRPSDNSIIAINPDSGAQQPIIQGELAAPGGLVFTQQGGKDTLIVSDAYGYRYADPVTGSVELLPFDLATNASSAVAVTTNSIVLSYVRRPAVVVIDRATGRARYTLNGFKVPMGVVAEESGDIFLADYGTGEILKLTPGATPDRVVFVSGLQGPVGIARSNDGQLIASEAISGTVSRVDVTTGAKAVIARELAQPEGIAILANGKIAVAEVGARKLSLIDPTTGAKETIADYLPVGQMFTRSPAPVFMPTGVTTAKDGSIFVTCDVDNTVLKFTPKNN